MLLTKHTDLALRVLMHLEVNSDKVSTVKEISQTYRVSQNHLVKVVHSLAKLKYIISTKGRGGGLKIAAKGSKATVAEIVQLMENTLEVFDCEGSNCPLSPACALQAAVNEASNAFLATLEKYRISDLVQNRSVYLSLIA